MNRLELVKNVFIESNLTTLFKVKKEQDYPEKRYSSVRVQTNDYRIRAFEIWETSKGDFFRIYHGSKINEELKTVLNELPYYLKHSGSYTDYRGEPLEIAIQIFEMLNSDEIIQLAKNNPVYTRNSAYEGLALPDVDTADIDILGKTFTWKEIIAISEDDSSENELKNELCKTGVYLQRSNDGCSRYVGSAYSEGGILARWLKHLTSNGDAKHLNLFVLENGYNNLLFTVLEFSDLENVIQLETKWKKILGTKNTGPYDGYRLNSN